jgi:4-azaleucine resistance transporter AzlC
VIKIQLCPLRLDMNTVNSRFVEFYSGVRDELPILLGVIPFGMIYGVLALAAGLPAGVAQAMSAVVFAGSAQFLAVKLIGTGTPALVVILTAFVVNLRHALYSASVAPRLQRLSPLWRGLLAYLLTDEAYVVTITHYTAPASSSDTGEGEKHFYFLGAGLALWTSWQISTAVGIFLGAQVPSSWSLDFTLALTFIALVIPNIKDRPSAAAALAAGVTAMLAYGLPYKLGLIAAALVGIVIGLWSEARWQKSG